MTGKDTYGSDSSRDMTLGKLKDILREKGVEHLYTKRLSPNDNSKNQPYFGGDYSSLNIIPTGDIVVAESSSGKKTGGAGKQIFKAPVKLSWVDPDGEVHPAPNAKLILYPQYPEVRFSGFLKGSTVKLSRWMSPEKEGRVPGRVLVLGVADNGQVYGYLAVPESPLANEISSQENAVPNGVFQELSMREGGDDEKSMLLMALSRIHREGWIRSKRLDKNGVVMDCNSSNCGGYTLEAELGITPNGFSEPDYLGWELKQFGVTSFDNVDSRIVTLMTPEPTGGVYKDAGVNSFLRRFGYPDTKGRPDRINFGGVHRCSLRNHRTNLLLRLDGFDSDTGRITDPSGGMVLETTNGVIAAKWHYSGLMEHWKRKHFQAAYIPSQLRRDKGMEYRYGNAVKLGEGTDFSRFLGAVSSGYVYYDPGIKMENASTKKPVTKRRSQFRIKTGNLGGLYEKLVETDVTAPL